MHHEFLRIPATTNSWYNYFVDAEPEFIFPVGIIRGYRETPYSTVHSPPPHPSLKDPYPQGVLSYDQILDSEMNLTRKRDFTVRRARGLGRGERKQAQAAQYRRRRRRRSSSALSLARSTSPRHPPLRQYPFSQRSLVHVETGISRCLSTLKIHE